MRLFKPTYRDKRTGKMRAVSKWWLELRDHLQIVRRFPAFTDKNPSRILGQQIEKLVACRITGQQPDPELTRWLERIPPKLTDRFVAIGLLDSSRAAAGKPLSQHLDDFAGSLRAKGNTPRHITQTLSRMRMVFEGCKFHTWSDIRAERVEHYLANLRNGGLSIQTTNYYLQGIKQFCRWMVQNRRASESPVAHLKRLNVCADRRHDRTALEVDEVRRLLQATRKAPERYGMAGPERVRLYQLAIETGLRANELRSLKVSSFDFRTNTVTVVAAYSKHRKEDTLPLRSETAEALEALFAGKTPEAKAFGGRYKRLTDKTSKMIEADLAEAGIDYTDDAGRYRDFHALRHTTGSWLAAKGVHPKVAQAIMRHSDINLTMSKYTHTLRGQEHEAVAMLPNLTAPDAQSQKATGTDGRYVKAESNLAENLAFSGARPCSLMQSRAEVTPSDAIKNGDCNTPGRTRTFDLRIRNPLLYPTELRAHQS
jgi:integrase